MGSHTPDTKHLKRAVGGINWSLLVAAVAALVAVLVGWHSYHRRPPGGVACSFFQGQKGALVGAMRLCPRSRCALCISACICPGATARLIINAYHPRRHLSNPSVLVAGGAHAVECLSQAAAHPGSARRRLEPQPLHAVSHQNHTLLPAVHTSTGRSTTTVTL